MTKSIEIFGGDFKNRGGQLMLYAVGERLRQRSATIRCAIDASPDAQYPDRSSYGLYTLCPSLPLQRPRFSKLARPLGRILSKIVKPSTFQNYGLIGSSQCDAILDISGYTYGDKWPAGPILLRLDRFKDYRRRHRPVLLLPQMFGPFMKPDVLSAFKQIANQADLICAREDASYQELMNAIPDVSDRLRLFPDLTIEVAPGELPESFPLSHSDEYVVVVPNVRMLDRGPESWRGVYIELMQVFIEHAVNAGLKVVLMQHEAGHGDAKLVDQLMDSRTIRVADSNPRRLKAVLKNAKLALCSRFHALVSALSSGTPCVTFGWAHKYPMLHRDFDLMETCYTDPPDRADFESILATWFDDSWISGASDKISGAKGRLLIKLDQMWQEVYARLGI